MPLGPPEDPERFPDFEACVDAIADPPDVTREDARQICGRWEQNVSARDALEHFSANSHELGTYAALRALHPDAPREALRANARFRANATASGRDPTQTTTLRARYSGEMYRRFRAMKGAIREGVIARDAFGLGESPARNDGGTASTVAANQGEFNLPVPAPGEFDFAQDPRRVEAFHRWIDDMVSAGILERDTLPDGQLIAAHRSWQDTYLRVAYSRGVEHADAAAREAGVIGEVETLENIFRVPRHADAAGLLFTRAFHELDGVTEAMSQEMGRILAEGLQAGRNPRVIGADLSDAIDGIGIERGRLIARTETIRAFNVASINRFESFGDRVDGLTLVAEFLTAGDDRVCPECQALEGRIFPIDEARGLIPVHPRCRCSWVPVPAEDRPLTLTQNVTPAA